MIQGCILAISCAVPEKVLERLFFGPSTTGLKHSAWGARVRVARPLGWASGARAHVRRRQNGVPRPRFGQDLGHRVYFGSGRKMRFETEP